jgi:tetratricopeptide (TPR) repeat protein
MKKTAKQPEKAVKSKIPAPPATAEAVPALDASQQVDLFEKAMKLLHAREFGQAQPLFQEAATGPSRDVAHSARLHLRICETRQTKPQLQLESAEDHYNYAISLINQWHLGEAEVQLREALEKAPDADHVHYALALARGLSGDLAGAAEHMRRAISLQPRNRNLARSDPDFAEIAQMPPLSEVLYPEKKASV